MVDQFKGGGSEVLMHWQMFDRYLEVPPVYEEFLSAYLALFNARNDAVKAIGARGDYIV